MAKGCGNCGKLHGYSLLECMRGSLPEPTVEKISAPELPTPVRVPLTAPRRPAERTSNTPEVPLTEPISTSNTEIGVPLTRNRKWERSHPEYKDWKRDYQREYMRRRRAKP